MPALDFLITEKPLAQARPRFLMQLARVYDPQSKNKRLTRQLIQQQIQLLREQNPSVHIPIGRFPIELNIVFYTSIPTAFKKVYDERDISNKDIDNYLKYLLDCLQPDFIANDCCIWKTTMSKIHSDNPRTEVTIQW